MAEPREFGFIPVWNIPVSLSYTMRRVNCPDCGVRIERVPWADGKHTQCNVFRHFLASWGKRLSWKETAACFGVKWDTVCRSVQWVVAYGLKNRSLDGIEALGVDEVAYSRGHKYMTLVYQIDAGRKRLIGVLKERTTKTLEHFFKEELGAERCAKVKVVCSDMWRPYLKVIAELLPSALNVLDRFHIAKKLGEAVDQIRREETKELRQRLRASSGQLALLLSQANREPERETKPQARRVAPIRFEKCASLSLERIFRCFLALRFAEVGAVVSEEMVR